MKVIYYDNNSEILSVTVDSRNVLFFRWEIYFDHNGEEYRIPYNKVISIERM